MSKQNILDTPLKNLELDAVVNAAKLVLSEDLREFCTAETIAEIYNEADYRELSIHLNTNRFTTVCRKAKRMANMFAMSGILLGSRDLLTKKNKWMAIRATGQRVLILRLDQEQVVEPTVWGHGPGDRNHKKTIPFWAKCQFMAETTTFTREGSDEKEEGTLLSYLEAEEPISSVELFAALQKYAKSPEMLEESDVYFPIVLRGAIGSFSPIDKWEDTGIMIDVLDRSGSPVIDKKTGKVVKRPERERAAEGFPLIQGRLDNPEEQIYTFQVTVNPLDDTIETINRVKFKFLNKKMARHLIAVPSQELVFRTAFQKGMGTANDSFDHLTDTYRGMDAYVIGVMTRFSHDEKRDLNWIDIEGTMLVTVVQGSSTPTSVPAQLVTEATPSSAPAATVPAPAPAPAPSIPPEVEKIAREANLYPPVVESPPIVNVPVVPATHPVVEPTVLPTAPVTPVVPAAPAAPPVIPPTPAEAEQPLVVRLKAAIEETMELHGKGMTVEEFEGFGLCPEELIDSATRKIKPDRLEGIQKAIAKVRQELGDKEVGSHGSTGPTSVSTLSAAEQKLMKETGTFECAACGAQLPDTIEEHRKHWAECPENPKNKAKAKTAAQ